MNTINGNFIEKSIPNTKNTTLNVNIGGVDATMTVSDFKNNVLNTATSLQVGTTTTLESSAALQIDSTTKGILIPRMAGAQILAIQNIATGLLVYNTDLQLPCFWNGMTWQRLTSAAM
jgi:hypothetical protein